MICFHTWQVKLVGKTSPGTGSRFATRYLEYWFAVFAVLVRCVAFGPVDLEAGCQQVDRSLPKNVENAQFSCIVHLAAVT